MAIALGIPVRNPDSRISSMLGISLSMSSSPWIFSNNLFRSSLKPNCRDTWHPTPNKGTREPGLDIGCTFVEGKQSFLPANLSEAMRYAQVLGVEAGLID